MKTTKVTRAVAPAVVAALAVSAPLAANAAEGESGTTVHADQSNFAELWDMSKTRVNGHYDLTDDGLAMNTTRGTVEGVVGDQGKAAGYTEHVEQLDQLAAEAEPTINVTVPNPETDYTPGLQVEVDLDADGTKDGILVGEKGGPGARDYWWLADATTEFKAGLNDTAIDKVATAPGATYRYNGSLDEWSDVFTDAETLRVGFSLGSGYTGSAELHAMTYGDTTYSFGLTENAVQSDVSYDLGEWDASQTRTAGHQEIEGDRLHVWTDDATSQAKAALYLPTDLALRAVGQPTLAWENAEGFTAAPGLQLVVMIDGQWGGTLVGEELYENKHWWVSDNSPAATYAPDRSGGHGSNSHGTLAQWAESFEKAGKDVRVAAVGYSLGSGMHGDGYVSSMTFAETTYTFAEPATTTMAVELPQPFAGTRSSVPVSVTSSDGPADGTVRLWVDGVQRSTRNLVDGQATLPVPALDAGTHAVSVTHSSGSEAFLSAEILRSELTVSKAPAVLEVEDARTSYGTPAQVVVDVTSQGATPDGGTVVVTADGFVRKAEVLNGKATFALPSGTVGSQDVVYAYKGNENVGSAKATASYIVTKAASTSTVSVSPTVGTTKTTPKVSVSVSSAGQVTGKARVTVTSPNGVSASRIVSLTDGKGSFTMSAKGKGTHKLSVKYLGDTNVKPSTATATYVVR